MNIYNRVRALDSPATDKDCDAHLHGIAFTELVAFMEDLWKVDGVVPIFKLNDMTQCIQDQSRTALVLLLKAAYIHTSVLRM